MKRFHQNLGLGLGLALGAVALTVLLWPEQEALHARGPMNTGHEDLRCEHCHVPGRGTLRQQLQANARHLLGLRETAADFGLQRVAKERCLACHERPDDRHPVFRFTEPRFEAARRALQPESCVSCHREHQGMRTTVATTDFCQHCHEETRLKNDPIDLSHESLVASERWDTCLGCHDFHGNHLMETRQTIDDVIPPGRILEYFRGGDSPYSTEKRYEARKEPVQ